MLFGGLACQAFGEGGGTHRHARMLESMETRADQASASQSRTLQTRCWRWRSSSTHNCKLLRATYLSGSVREGRLGIRSGPVSEGQLVGLAGGRSRK